jgi:hypothetical protein
MYWFFIWLKYRFSLKVEQNVNSLGQFGMANQVYQDGFVFFFLKCAVSTGSQERIIPLSILFFIGYRVPGRNQF